MAWRCPSGFVVGRVGSRFVYLNLGNILRQHEAVGTCHVFRAESFYVEYILHAAFAFGTYPRTMLCVPSPQLGQTDRLTIFISIPISIGRKAGAHSWLHRLQCTTKGERSVMAWPISRGCGGAWWRGERKAGTGRAYEGRFRATCERWRCLVRFGSR
jgi:hypothetical protein